MQELLGEKLLGKNGTVDTSTIDADCIGFYFSGHWCPPCRAFTPQLASIYDSVKKKGKKFEVVFISSDQGEDEFQQYFGEMPWLALPFEDRLRKELLTEKYKVSGIPCLVLLNRTGEIITEKGRKAVTEDKTGDSWIPGAETKEEPPKPQKDDGGCCALM